jgi:hypothetical protein
MLGEVARSDGISEATPGCVSKKKKAVQLCGGQGLKSGQRML